MNETEEFKPTKFEQVTANQLAIGRDRKKPAKNDIKDAIAICKRANEARVKLKLKEWK